MTEVTHLEKCSMKTMHQESRIIIEICFSVKEMDAATSYKEWFSSSQG
jgi:hypothetical protein